MDALYTFNGVFFVLYLSSLLRVVVMQAARPRSLPQACGRISLPCLLDPRHAHVLALAYGM